MRHFILPLLLMLSLAARAYTTVEGFYGETWLDHVDEDGFGGGNFGDGSQANPWQIRSAGALAYLARAVNRGQTFEGKYFVIAAHINLAYAPSGTTLVWVPIGCTTNPGNASSAVFKGTLTNGTDASGKPYEITGMTIRAHSTATTTCFGLFGALRGTVEGLVLRRSALFVDQTTDEYFAGAVCGYLGASGPTTISQRWGSVRNCTAEQTTIEATSSRESTAIGGLVGCATLDMNELAHNLAKTAMRLTGPMEAGGVVGETWWNLLDCHAVVDMTIGNTTDSECTVGGIVGYSAGLWDTTMPDKIIAVKCCTSSGEIRGSGNKINMGGIIGNAQYALTMTACTTCTALSGGYTMGGLIGNAYSMSGNDGMMVKECYCSSYVDGTAATNAGGLFGYVKYDYRASNHSITPNNNTEFSYFAGTMKKPANSERYGTIVGYADGYKRSGHLKFGYFKRDYRQCNLQTNSNGWADDGDDLALATYFTPRPVDGDFRFDQNAERPQVVIYPEGRDLFYTDNMRLAGTPFNVTGDGQAFFDLWDATVDFQIGTFKNRSTQEEIATFTLPLPPACVEVQENVVKLLDPGEADVYVNYHGLQRKVHLTLTYGQPWDGRSTPTRNYNDYFAGGDGTARNPYVIHNVQELVRVLANRAENNTPEEYRYNMAGKHYILANDLFFNTHLLGEDEQPREGAQAYNPYYVWRGVLHGNGKTIYGLYVDQTNLTEDASCGLFASIEGSVSDLAIVDSYVRASMAPSSNVELSAGVLCGKLDGGTVERCLVHGTVLADGYAGGLCGQASGEESAVADCFAGVHIGWAGRQDLFKGAGIAYTTPAAVRRCVSIGRIEHGGAAQYGITQTGASCTDCWYDGQMMAADVQTHGYATTRDIISGQLLANAAAWQNAEQRYPMLRQFARTTYGELLSMAVRFAQADRAGSIAKIFDFPTENVLWRARSGSSYLDVINECGAAAPNGRTGTLTEHLLAETVGAKSQCTKALRALAVNVTAEKSGIEFADPQAATAATAAFDTDGDRMVSLREAFEATKAQFATFNEAASEVETFSELRYFAGFATLESKMISGLGKLRQTELPQSLTTIATGAFDGCTSLKEVELPHQFQTLQEGGFHGSGIKNILVAERNIRCRSIGGVLYQNNTLDDDKVMLMAYPPGRGQEEATLSAPLSAILPYAIYKVPGLRKVYIDNCLPQGEMAELQDNGIVSEEAGNTLDVLVNDGSLGSQLFQDYCNDDTWGELYYDEGHLAIYYPLNVSSAGWATLYIDFPTLLPEGLEAYIASYTDADEKIVELHSIGRIIPRSTPVAIKAAEAGLYPLFKYHGTVPDVNKWENRFVGSFIGQDGRFGVPVNQETAVEGSLLTLGRNSQGVVGFYKYNGSQIPPYRAYLTRNNIIEANAIRLGRSYADETSIEGTTTDNGRGMAATATVDLAGRRMPSGPLPRGIYIVNGKKVVIR